MPSSHLIFSHPLLLLPPILPSIRVFSNESTLRMRWPKYWSFSFSIIPSKEIPGLISFRMDLVGSPCSPRDSQESSPTPQFKSINSSALTLLRSKTLTSIHEQGKTTALTRQSTGEGNGKSLQYSCLENTMNRRKRQNDRIPKEELPRSVGAQ